jgi:hypothetical protein
MEYDLLYRIAQLYNDAGAKEQAKKFAKMGIERANYVITNKNIRPDIVQYEVMNRYLGPYRYSAEMYKLIGDYQGGIDAINKLRTEVEAVASQLEGRQGYESQFQRVQSNLVDVFVMLDDMEISKLEAEGKLDEAIKLAETKMDKYRQDGTQISNTLSSVLYRKYMELQRKAGADTLAEGSDE